MIDKIIRAAMSWLERRRLRRAALAYNAAHTFSLTGLGAGTWMCPVCGRVHRAHSTSKFSGPQFDACCDIEAGGRTDRRHAITF